MWIGVDPGKDTGIVLRDLDRLIWWTVVEGLDPEGCEVIPKVTLDAVSDAIDEAMCRASSHDTATPSIAVEGVVKPNAYHKGKIAFVDPFAVAAPSVVLGAVMAAWSVSVVVRPDGHGSRWLSTYPAELVTNAERRHGLNRPASPSSKALVRHARSGWDVAGAAPLALRIQTARAGAR